MRIRMRSFTYVVKDEEGLHARPARLLVKEAEKLASVVMLDRQGQKCNAKKIFGIMALGVKKGEEITVTVEGDTENEDYDIVKEFFEGNL